MNACNANHEGETAMVGSVKIRGGRKLMACVRVLAMSLGIWVGWAQAAEPVVTLLPGKPFFVLGSYDINGLGYAMEEFSVSGTATSFKVTGEAGPDGKWTVTPDATAPYATRIVVIKPSDPHKFNGTVVIEWLNVTGGLDVPVDWVTVHRELIRGGYAYVGVSAQKVGVEGGPSMSRGTARPLKTADPARYGQLSHPGDAFSYDIYSQAGRLLRSPQAVALLGVLRPRHLIAMGESQSAFFLATYVNAVDPVAKVYDGIVIHSRGSAAAPLDNSGMLGAAASQMSQAVRLRSDLRAPVMQVITETDLLGFGAGGFYRARQPDTDQLRVWEIAGTAHADNYLFGVGMIDSGLLPIEQLATPWAPTRAMQGMQLDKAMNNAPQHHYVTEAALWQMNRWLSTGNRPPKAPPLTLTASDPRKFVTDANGNAVGGIRTPWVDVPTERLSGLGSSGLVGSSEPYDKAMLDRLYPGGRPEYLRKFQASLDAAIKAGFILKADRQEILDIARVSYQVPE
jgi:hypothetical protein